jgi:hypothetical protein
MPSPAQLSFQMQCKPALQRARDGTANWQWNQMFGNSALTSARASASSSLHLLLVFLALPDLLPACM